MSRIIILKIFILLLFVVKVTISYRCQPDQNQAISPSSVANFCQIFRCILQKMSQTVDDLNYDFNYNLFIAKTLVSNLQKQEDKNRSLRWMKKLSTCNRTINEMNLRNDFMYYLIVNMQNGELQPPFNENPPQKPLPSIAHFLVNFFCLLRNIS